MANGKLSLPLEGDVTAVTEGVTAEKVMQKIYQSKSNSNDFERLQSNSKTGT
ncbi:MAG: hypothetical protein WCO98_06560 [bacterium]